MTPRQIAKYIRRADDLLVERQDRGRRRLVARHLAQRQALYARALKAADYRTALAVLTDEAKLRGLYVSDRELRALARLAAEQGERIRTLEARLADPDRASGDVPLPDPPGREAGRGPTGGPG